MGGARARVSRPSASFPAPPRGAMAARGARARREAPRRREEEPQAPRAARQERGGEEAEGLQGRVPAAQEAQVGEGGRVASHAALGSAWNRDIRVPERRAAGRRGRRMDRGQRLGRGPGASGRAAHSPVVEMWEPSGDGAIRQDARPRSSCATLPSPSEEAWRRSPALEMRRPIHPKRRARGPREGAQRGLHLQRRAHLGRCSGIRGCARAQGSQAHESPSARPRRRRRAARRACRPRRSGSAGGEAAHRAAGRRERRIRRMARAAAMAARAAAVAAAAAATTRTPSAQPRRRHGVGLSGPIPRGGLMKGNQKIGPTSQEGSPTIWPESPHRARI